MRKAAGTRDSEKTEVPVKVEPYFLNHESAKIFFSTLNNL